MNTESPQKPPVPLITPTVGRIVWYWDPGSYNPQAAIVTGVLSDSLVDVTIFPRGAEPVAYMSISLYAEPDGGAAYGHCSWMPYQTGQAAKAEDLRPRVEALEQRLAPPPASNRWTLSALWPDGSPGDVSERRARLVIEERGGHIDGAGTMIETGARDISATFTDPESLNAARDALEARGFLVRVLAHQAPKG